MTNINVNSNTSDDNKGFSDHFINNINPKYDIPSNVMDLLNTKIDEHLHYVYGNSSLSKAQQSVLAKAASNTIQAAIHETAAKKYAADAAKYAPELGSANANLHASNIASQQAHEARAKYYSNIAQQHSAEARALGSIPKGLAKTMLANAGNAFSVISMAEAIKSNDAGEISKAGLSILGGMAAAGIVATMLAGSSALAAGATLLIVGTLAGWAISTAWDYFNATELLGLDAEAPAFDPFFEMIHDLTGWDGDLIDLLPDDLAKLINDWTGLNRVGRHYFVSDPLILDLDGDGIETVAHQGSRGAMFDLDADGIANGTGWVKSDDGILVLDRNGDGMINDGRELFGDSVILADGRVVNDQFFLMLS